MGTGHKALSQSPRSAVRHMLDQNWLGFFGDINDLPDDDLNTAIAVFADVRLKRLTPPPV